MEIHVETQGCTGLIESEDVDKSNRKGMVVGRMGIPAEPNRCKVGTCVICKQVRPRKLSCIVAMALVVAFLSVATAHAATAASSHPTTSFDTDSFKIGINNHSSYTMTNNEKDFINKPQPVSTRIKGISGYLSSIKKGTVKWKIEDNSGHVHILITPNCLYPHTLPIWLLSPQHLAQVLQEGETMEEGTVCTTTHHRLFSGKIASSVELWSSTLPMLPSSALLPPTTPLWHLTMISGPNVV